ncbi:MAG TPA: tetratricopeptide repeat protein [Terriglobia bacterium]|nr:tetratricopeptide repeat protein [Terriglobia bacterium]
MKQKCLGLVVVLLFACVGMGAAPPRVLLVFPLENLSGNSSLGWMSEGIAELIATRLASPSRIVLERSDRNDACDQLGLSPQTPLTLASEYKVARALGASVAVVGRFTVSGDQLTTRVQWLNLPDLSLSRPVVLTGKLTDLDVLETRLAWELLKSRANAAAIGTEGEFADRFPDVRLDAFESYIRGILSTDSKSEIHFLQEADHLNPRDHRAAFALGKYYFEQESYADSARWLQFVKSGDRDYGESLFLLGVDEYELGHNVLAEAAFKKLPVMFPLGEVFNNLGAVELNAGRYDEALADLQRALQKDPENSDYTFNMSLTLWHLQKYSQAGKYLQEVLAQGGDDLEAHFLLAQVSGELGDSEARKTELAWVSAHQKGSADDPPGDSSNAQPDPPLRPRISKEYDSKAFHLHLLQLVSAEHAGLAEQEDEGEKKEGQIRLEKGLGLLAGGNLPEAERDLTEAVFSLPDSSAAHQALGQVYEREGKHTLAATEFQTALAQKESFEAHLGLAKAYVSLDHLDPALKQVEAAQHLDPANLEAQNLAKDIRAQLAAHRDKP